jgi:hypothetical protein
MRISFPSSEFDDAVAAVCHDSALDEQVRALHELLRSDLAARDEYILRLELHSRLASEPDLFASAEPHSSVPADAGRITPLQDDLASRYGQGRNRWKRWGFGLAAGFALLAAGLWSLRPLPASDPNFQTSKAVAMLSRTVDAQWNALAEAPKLSAPLDPGWLRLESGLAQVVFYSGARVVMEGPSELELISQNKVTCRRGRITAEIPPQARGFEVVTPQAASTSLGASFGLNVNDHQTELHVFEGSVQLQAVSNRSEQNLEVGSGAVIERSGAPRLIRADMAAFASLFELQERSVAAEALRHDQWRLASERLQEDSSLLVHFDFEDVAASRWQLRNLSRHPVEISDATIVGCQRAEGRWPNKRALEFQSGNDRVRLSVPGEFSALTLAAWVRVQGLDRKLNSLFMCDGFLPGTVHWLIRHDGVLGLTVIGGQSGNYQIVASPPVLTLEKFGMWIHLAVVLDGNAKRVVHYVNGLPVSETSLKPDGPFRIGEAELGNWNGKGFPQDDPFMIRNFSGAMDEFCLFSRALDAREIRTLYSEGKPEREVFALQFR